MGTASDQVPWQARTGFILASCLAAGVAFWATGKHPYNFYVLTRWLVFLTCCWGVWLHCERGWVWFAPGYVIMGLIFNPILPFHFRRSTWQVLDIAAGVVLLASLAGSLALAYRGRRDG